MGDEKNKGIVEKIWDFFASVKFAIIIFSLISVTSIVGTILEQGAERSKNMKLLGRLFGESVAPALYNVFNSLGFMDMYHSWWFNTLLVLFAVNIIICSLDRLPRIIRIIREPMRPASGDQILKSPIRRETVIKAKPDIAKKLVEDSLKSTGFRFTELKEGKGYLFYSQKGAFSRLGIYLTHLSILFILAGAIIGASFGFKGFLPVPEGQSASLLMENRGHFSELEEQERHAIFNAVEEAGNASGAASRLNMSEDLLKAKMQKYGILPLGFSIRCDDFSVDFYEGSDMPRDFKSRLTVIDNGKEVMKKTIEVNDPMTYKGITFYQSSYGPVPDAKGEFIFRITPQGGISEIKQLHFGDSFAIPGTMITGTIRDFSPALSFDHDGKPFTYTEMMNNPAVMISFLENGKEKYSGWILRRYPATWMLPDGHNVEFMDLWGAQYTGLQVRKDPGVWIVYFGCFAMATGLFVAFFMSHRRIWVSVMEDKNTTKVIIGANTNKNRAGFERKLDRMITLLSSHTKEEK